MMLAAVYGFAAILLVPGILIVAIGSARFFGWLASLCFLAAAFALAVVVTTPGVYYNYDLYFGDFWTATEAINKVASGHLSSVDYFNPIGPVYTQIFRLWALIEPVATAATVVRAGALAGAMAAVFAVVMLGRRLSLLGLAVVVLSAVAVAVSGRGNGELLQAMPMHYLAPYNRWGWALFIPVAIALALPHRRDRFADVALGVAIAILLMLKVTYGAAAIGLIVVRVVLVPGALRELGGIVAGLIIALVSLELATGQVSAHLSDLAMTAQFGQSGLRPLKLFTQLGEVAIFVAAAIVTYYASLTARASLVDLRPILLILMVAGAGCAILMQNHYAVEAAIYPLLPLIALEWTGALRQSSIAPSRQARALIGGLTAAMLFYPVVDIGMHVGQRLQFARNGPDPAFASTPYANLRFEPYIAANPEALLNQVGDGRAGVLEGLSMLRAAGADRPETGTTMTLSFANPFPMFLDKPSPGGTPLWLHEERSFSRDTHIPGDVFFEGVDYVLTEPDPGVLGAIYQDLLATEFAVAAQGTFWTLHVRQ